MGGGWRWVEGVEVGWRDIRERHDKMPLLQRERGWRDTESQDAPFGERGGVGGGVGRVGVGGWVGRK